MGSAAETAEREAAIARARLGGREWLDIAEEFSVARSTAIDAYNRWRDRPKELEADDPLEYVREHLDRLEAIYFRQGGLAAKAERKGQWNAATAASNTQLGALNAMLDLRQASGLLPRQLGKLRVELDIRQVAVTLVQLLDKYQLPLEARRELMDVLEGKAVEVGEDHQLGAGDGAG